MILNNIGDDRGVMKSYKLRDLSVVAFEHRWEKNMSYTVYGLKSLNGFLIAIFLTW